MATRLGKTIRREVEIDGEAYTVAISPEGLRLTKKRFRSGVAISWRALWRQHNHFRGERQASPQDGTAR